jgi:outer membrane scaffolding protein for murein synthesis (MipA/OmpV family)
MKYFLSFILMAWAGSALAQGGRPEAADWKIRAGGMVFGQSELLHSDRGGADYSGIPFLTVAYKDFYWKGMELGYEWQASSLIKVRPFVQVRGGLGLAGAPAVFGGKSIEASELADGYQGIEDRKHQFEAAVSVEFDWSRTYALELEGRWGERGSTAKALLKRSFASRDFKGFISPYVSCRILSPEFIDYYFGVSAAEAADPDSYKIQSAYDGDRVGFAGAFGVSGMFRVNDRWSLISSIEEQVVSDEIRESPLVRSRGVLTVGLGAIYQF